jgi:hypothetical protein
VSGRLPDGAVALQPVRLTSAGDLRVYSAVTFPRDPYAGCERTVRILRGLGFLSTEDTSPLMLDVLDANGDIIADVPVTRRGFEYLRRRWRFVALPTDRARGGR